MSLAGRAPTRGELLEVLGEVFVAIPDGDWRRVTEQLSPPCREWFADAVDEYFAEDGGDAMDAPEVKADRWWRPKPDPDRTPCPEGFLWIGQPMWSCDKCGLPAWEHAGEVRAGSLFITGDWALRPWGPGVADAIRLKWEPAMRAEVRA